MTVHHPPFIAPPSPRRTFYCCRVAPLGAILVSTSPIPDTHPRAGLDRDNSRTSAWPGRSWRSEECWPGRKLLSCLDKSATPRGPRFQGRGSRSLAPKTGDHRDNISTNEGRYSFPLLLPGHYELKVEKEGFETQAENRIVVETASISTVDVTLKVGSATERVSVDATVPLLQTESSAVTDGDGRGGQRQHYEVAVDLLDISDLRPEKVFLRRPSPRTRLVNLF